MNFCAILRFSYSIKRGRKTRLIQNTAPKAHDRVSNPHKTDVHFIPWRFFILTAGPRFTSHTTVRANTQTGSFKSCATRIITPKVKSNNSSAGSGGNKAAVRKKARVTDVLLVTVTRGLSHSEEIRQKKTSACSFSGSTCGFLYGIWSEYFPTTIYSLLADTLDCMCPKNDVCVELMPLVCPSICRCAFMRCVQATFAFC